MEIKFSLSTGSLSLDYHGDAATFQKTVEPWCERLLAKIEDGKTSITVAPTDVGGHAKGPAVAQPQARRPGTINTVISKLGGNSCRNVMQAAAIHLTLFQGQERFSDEQWDTTAREANAWKSKWSTEKATAKKRLVNVGFVIENAKGMYSLSEDNISDAKSKLA